LSGTFGQNVATAGEAVDYQKAVTAVGLLGHVVLLWFATEFIRNAVAGLGFGVVDVRLARRRRIHAVPDMAVRRQLALSAHQAGAFVSIPLSVAGGIGVRIWRWDAGNFDVIALAFPIVASVALGTYASVRAYSGELRKIVSNLELETFRRRQSDATPPRPSAVASAPQVLPLANCRRIKAACRVCGQPGEVLQSQYHVADRSGNPIYAGKCCACGGLNIVAPMPSSDLAIVQSFEETDADLRRTMERWVERFGFDEGVG
jgi:hypothetical protein